MYPLVYENLASTGLTTIPRALDRPQTSTEKFTHSFQIESRGKGVALRLFPRYSQKNYFEQRYDILLCTCISIRSPPPSPVVQHSDNKHCSAPDTCHTFATDCVKDRSTFRTIQRPEAESTDSNSVASYTANYYHSDLVDSYVSIQHSPYPSMTGFLST